MAFLRTTPLSALVLGCFAPIAAPQALVPAGSINAAAAATPRLLLAPKDEAVLRFVTSLRDRLFRGTTIVEGAADRDQLAGHSLIVYATPEHPLLAAHRELLPFAYGEGTVTVDGRTFRGEHLRLIAAVRNPADRERRALLYTAARTEDLVEINAVFHGPTEWVVADGRKVLAQGSFLHGITLSPQQMAGDVDQLVATLREVHPATAGGEPAALTAAIAAARAQLQAPLDRLAFAKILAGIAIALQDAHTAVALPRSGEAIDLPFVWIDDGPIVTTDSGSLRRGDRIVAIAGVDAAELERRLAALVPAENPHWRRQQAPGLLTDLGFLRTLGVAERLPVVVRIERAGNAADVEVGSPAPAPRKAAPEWVRFTIDREHSLGVFTFDRCVVDKQYTETLAKFFTAVHEQGIRRVAVDLRANSGGNSAVTNAFLRHLDVDEFADFSGDVRWSKPVHAQRGSTGKAWLERAKPQRRRNDPIDEPPPFRGELYVLIGPATFSSGNWFATVMQDNKLAKLVGEPTGNAPSSFGDILSFVLPESGTSFTVSWKRWVRPDPARDPAPCLLPDVAVPRTRASVQAGTDPVLDWLRAAK